MRFVLLFAFFFSANLLAASFSSSPSKLSFLDSAELPPKFWERVFKENARGNEWLNELLLEEASAQEVLSLEGLPFYLVSEEESHHHRRIRIFGSNRRKLLRFPREQSR